jgi:DnaJ-class molecular chaperone
MTEGNCEWCGKKGELTLMTNPDVAGDEYWLCKKCIAEQNERHDTSEDYAQFLPVCPDCGGNGHAGGLDDVVDCATCDGNGYLEDD